MKKPSLWTSLSLASLFALSVAGTALASEPEHSQPHDVRSSVLWMGTSVEYAASTTQVWKLGCAQIDKALADKNWTAAVEQEGTDFQDKPPAVITDLDETAILNLSFQAEMIKRGMDYSSKIFSEWKKYEAATPIPGAVECLQEAHKKGVQIFYVTAGKHKVEGHIKNNLEKLGFPMTEGVDTLLTKNEKPEWRSDKSTRRAHIAEDYRIVAMFGDKMNDFVSGTATKTLEGRNAVYEQHKDKIGEKWFVLPNPLYGDWDQSLYERNFKLSEKEQRDMKEQYLKPFSELPPPS